MRGVCPGYSGSVRPFTAPLSCNCKLSSSSSSPLHPTHPLTQVPLLFFHISPLVVHSHFLSKHFFAALCFRPPPFIGSRITTNWVLVFGFKPEQSSQAVAEQRWPNTNSAHNLPLIIHFLWKPRVQDLRVHMKPQNWRQKPHLKVLWTYFHQWNSKVCVSLAL